MQKSIKNKIKIPHSVFYFIYIVSIQYILKWNCDNNVDPICLFIQSLYFVMINYLLCSSMFLKSMIFNDCRYSIIQSGEVTGKSHRWVLVSTGLIVCRGLEGPQWVRLDGQWNHYQGRKLLYIFLLLSSLWPTSSLRT